MPIKSLVSPWRLQQGCQLMSLVTVVCVAGTAAHGGLSTDPSPAALVCGAPVNKGLHRWGGSTDSSQISFIHSFIHHEGDRSCIEGRTLGAQISSPVIFFLFPPCLSCSRADILCFPLCKLTRINTSLKAAAYTALQPSRYSPSWLFINASYLSNICSIPP